MMEISISGLMMKNIVKPYPQTLSPKPGLGLDGST